MVFAWIQVNGTDKIKVPIHNILKSLIALLLSFLILSPFQLYFEHLFRSIQIESLLLLSMALALFIFLSNLYFQKLHSSSEDRKSTRLNSSHVRTSYAVFCLIDKSNFEGDSNQKSKIKAAKEIVAKSVRIESELPDLLGTKKADAFEKLIEYVGADGKYIALTKSVRTASAFYTLSLHDALPI